VFQNSYIFWIISGLIFLIIDKKISNNLTLSLAYALLINSGIAFKNPDNIKFQIVSFFLLWGLSCFLIVGALKKEKLERENEKNIGNYKNHCAIVLKDIGRKFSLDGVGRIKYKDMIFKAKSIDDKKIKAGQKVKLVSRFNNIFNVEVVKNAQD